jgi:endonuclease YncB( thermonuclease family)
MTINHRWRRYHTGARQPDTSKAQPRDAEAEARAARRGLWADPDSVPPWEWRKTENERFRMPQDAF